MRRGDEAFYYKEYDKSYGHYQKAAEEKPNEAVPRLRMGQIHYARSEYEAARKKFQNALDLKQNSITRKFIRTALSLMETNGPLLRQIETLSAEKASPSELAPLHLKAAMSMSRGESYMSLIAPHLERALESARYQTSILAALADGFYLSSHPASAAQFYEELVELKPEDLALRKRLGDTYVAMADYDKAGTQYRRALELAKEVPGTGERQEQITEIRKLLQALPPETAAIQNLIDEEEYDAAMTALRRRIARNPGDVQALTLIGAIHQERDQNWRAARAYRRVLELQPEYPGVHYHLGTFYLMKEKKFEKSVGEFQLFKKYLKETLHRITDPQERKRQEENLVRAARSIAYIYAEVLKKPRSAIRELEWAKKRDPENIEIWYDLGVSYARARKRAPAFQALRKVIELDPESELAERAEEVMDLIRSRPDYGAYYD